MLLGGGFHHHAKDWLAYLPALRQRGHLLVPTAEMERSSVLFVLFTGREMPFVHGPLLPPVFLAIPPSPCGPS